MEVHTGGMLPVFKWAHVCKVVSTLSHTWKDFSNIELYSTRETLVGIGYAAIDN